MVGALAGSKVAGVAKKAASAADKVLTQKSATYRSVKTTLTKVKSSAGNAVTKTKEHAKSVKTKITQLVKKSGSNTGTWDMTEGGGVINGREYSQHAMERMAPDTPTVRAERRRAEKAAQQKGLEVGIKNIMSIALNM